MFKQIILKIDDTRENLEDFIVDNVLVKWDEYKNADALREQVCKMLVASANAYVMTYGVSMPDDVQEKVAKYGVKLMKNLNAKLQTQLSKKSKMYKDRHNGN